MPEEAVTVKREPTVVVENLDETMHEAARARPTPQSGSAVESPSEDKTSVAQLLGREAYTWTSPFTVETGSNVVRFRRPPFGTREMVVRVLGSQQADNPVLVRQYLAVASIIEINGDRVSQPKTTMTFAGLAKRVAWVGPGDDDCFDDALTTFSFACECALYPGRLEAIADLEGAGLSPDDERRILKNAGLERPKA